MTTRHHKAPSHRLAELPEETNNHAEAQPNDTSCISSEEHLQEDTGIKHNKLFYYFLFYLFFSSN